MARRLEEYRGKCKLQGTELTIKGKKYSSENLHNLPANISTHVISSRQDSQYYGFLGEFSPLSNFHPALFIHDGVKYHTSEQYIQKMKADFSNDKETATQIMLADTPLECKRLGRSVKNYNIEAWNSTAMDLCYPGLLSKFQQNPRLSSFLKKTRDRTIFECCYNDVWGNGVPLSNPKCIDPNVFDKQGILGFMLENIRCELNNPPPPHHDTLPSQNMEVTVNEQSITCGN